VRRLREALARRDVAAVREAAHSFKGSSQYVGANQVVGLSAALEQQARAGLLFDADELMAQLEREFARVSQVITAMVQLG
jgi:HPt (histidine-containing phosphotransfer) domain-containing protein